LGLETLDDLAVLERVGVHADEMRAAAEHRALLRLGDRRPLRGRGVNAQKRGDDNCNGAAHPSSYSTRKPTSLRSDVSPRLIVSSIRYSPRASGVSRKSVTRRCGCRDSSLAISSGSGSGWPRRSRRRTARLSIAASTGHSTRTRSARLATSAPIGLPFRNSAGSPTNWTFGSPAFGRPEPEILSSARCSGVGGGGGADGRD